MEFDKKTTRSIIKIAAFVIIFAFLLNHIGSLFSIIGGVLGLLSPLIIGAALAFIMNVPMSGFEKYFFKKIKKDSLRRLISIVCSFLAVIFVITLVMGLVVPEIAGTVHNIIQEFPVRMQQTQEWFDKLMAGNEELEGYFTAVWENLESYIMNFIDGLDFSSSAGFISKMTGAISGTVSAVINIFMGIIFSFYVLMQKENLSRQAKRFLAVLFQENICRGIIGVLRLSNDTFRKFITGQCLEAVILGGIFFVCMTIFGMPYALTISVLIMLVSLIPVLGSFVGCIAGTFLILFVNPIQALVFVIMFLVIQQIEGNMIYPHVVGNSIGLPSIWVFVAVVIGGNLFGILGMLVFIPLSSILYTLLKGWVKKKEQQKIEKA